MGHKNAYLVSTYSMLFIICMHQHTKPSPIPANINRRMATIHDTAYTHLPISIRLIQPSAISLFIANRLHKLNKT